MRTISEVFTAGQTKRIQLYASYFRLMEISAGMRATIRVLKMGATRTEAENVDAGYAFKSAEFFDAIEIVCPNACTVVFAVSDGTGTYDRVAGEVSILGTVPVSGEVGVERGGILAISAPVSVGTAAVATLVANSASKALYFRAADANTAPIYLGSNTVTTVNATIKLNPGDTYIEEVQAKADWFAISTAAGQSLNLMRGT